MYGTAARLCGFIEPDSSFVSTRPKGGNSHAENISAEEAPQKEGAWLQKENVNV